MKLLNLKVEGFRSLRNVSWEPGDLNLLVGPNASGKTNLLKVIDLLSAAAGGRLSERVRKEGGIVPVMWNGRCDSLKIAAMVRQPMAREPEGSELLSYRLLLKRLGDTSAYRIENETLEKLGPQLKFLQSEENVLLDRDASRAVIYDWMSQRRTVQMFSKDETLLSTTANNPLAARSDIYAFQAWMHDWTVYEIIDTRRGSPIRQPALTRHEKRVSPSGDNLAPVLQTLHEYDIDFRNEIYAAMQAAFGDQFHELAFLTAGEGQIQLGVRWNGLKRPQSAASLSDGTLRFLFLLTVLASEDVPPIIAIEEPEIGLHPCMFPIIAEFASVAATRSQVINSTHSPEFLDAFRDTTVSTTVFESHEGETVCAVLEGEELQEWLKDYRLGELHVSNELSIWLQRRVEELEATRQTET